MKTMPFAHPFCAAAGVAALLLVASGGAASAQCCSAAPPESLPGIVHATLVWPAAPEKARIAYIGAVASEADVGKREGGLTRFRQVLSGTRTSYVTVQRPHDVYGDDAGRVYVSDGSRRGVLVFDPTVKAARTLGTAGEGRLVKPMGLGGDGAHVFVADQGGKRVVAFDADGRYVASYGGDSVLLNPVDVAVDPTGDIVWVVDSYLHQAIGFDRSSGEVVRRIGKHAGDIEAKKRQLAGLPESLHGRAAPRGAVDSLATSRLGHTQNYSAQPRDLVENRGLAPGEFRYPGFIAIGPDGSVWVSDAMNFRVQGFTRDGTFIAELGGLGDRPGRLARPKGVGVDSDGNIYVADAAFNNIQIFDQRGRLLLAFSEMGSGPGALWMPLGLYITRGDGILVADRYNDRVQRYEYLPERATVVTGDAAGR